MIKLITVFTLFIATMACSSNAGSLHISRQQVPMTTDQYLRYMQIQVNAANAQAYQFQQLNRANENFQHFIESDPSKW